MSTQAQTLANQANSKLQRSNQRSRQGRFFAEYSPSWSKRCFLRPPLGRPERVKVMQNSLLSEHLPATPTDRSSAKKKTTRAS